MTKQQYNPESYWSEVGGLIRDREFGQNVIAGDDEPYYRYKRDEFLKLLSEIDFKGRSVLEIGHGPGGNLRYIAENAAPSRLSGVDISQTMVDLARKNLPNTIDLHKINGVQLPFEDGQFDIVFSATVLQHNTDDAMLRAIMAEMARVSNSQVVIFERIEDTIFGDDLCLGRPIAYYNTIMKQHGFDYSAHKFINIRVSYYICGAARKLLNSKTRKEGEPLSGFSVFIQKVTLPFTKLLDKVFTSNKDLAKVMYQRASLDKE